MATLRTMMFGSLILPAAVAGLLTAACGGDDGSDGTSWQQLGAGGACSIYGPSPDDPATRSDAGTDGAPEEATTH